MRPMSWEEFRRLVQMLGGELYDGGRRALAPGPGHSPADRSLSLALSGGRLLVHSFAGDDWREVCAALRSQGLIGPLTWSASDAPPASLPPTRSECQARVAELWGQGASIGGTAAARHLTQRGVRRSAGTALRFHPALPARLYENAGPRRPGLLAAISDPAGRLVGLEATYLTEAGTRAALRTPRKTIGRRPAGAAVRLDPADDILVVGEGVFTCLSASEHFGRPAWALLAVANLRVWTAPAPVRRVLIAADRGRAGEAGAAALQSRLTAAGVAASIHLPPESHGDWNDWARFRRGWPD